MRLLAHYVIATLLFLFQLVLTSAQESEQNIKCPVFQCGRFGKVGFPFSNTSNPECGLCVLDCSGTQIKVKCEEGEWLDVYHLDYSTKRIDFKYRVDPTQAMMNGTLCPSKRNYTHQLSPFLSIIDLETRLFIKCKHELDPTIPSDPFHGLVNYTGCKGYELVNYTGCKGYELVNYTGCKGYGLLYSHDPLQCLPEPLSKRCFPVHLPSTSPQSLHSCLADTLTSSGDGIFRAIWKVSPICWDCHSEGNQCISSNGMFVCANLEKPNLEKAAKIGRKIGIGVLAGIASILLILTLALFYCCCWTRSQKLIHLIMFSKRNRKAQKVVEDFLKNYGSLAPKRYNYHEITKITNSFKIKLGQGGFGVVYKGKLVDDRLVAVKLLDKAKANGEEFMNEVASISRTSHVNVVQLLGFCFDGTKRALIYEFMANGSLEKFIYDHPSEARSCLEWKTLYEIVIGVARGLEYLHRGCNTCILHFDIKPHNILLDQDFTPKISDFGLAKLCPRNQSMVSMLDARGTAGYTAPEVFSRNFGRVSHKSDVYSYGMMVFEIVGKRKNIDARVDHTSKIYYPHWIYKRLQLDEDLGLDGIMSEEEEEMTRKMLLVALWCIQTVPTDRPTMSRVVEMLEGSPELLSIPPMPNLCSPSRDPIGSSILSGGMVI